MKTKRIQGILVICATLLIAATACGPIADNDDAGTINGEESPSAIPQKVSENTKTPEESDSTGTINDDKVTTDAPPQVIDDFTAEEGSYITVVLNGEEVSFDISPQVIDGHVMVPIRRIYEAMNIDVYWFEGIGDVSARQMTAIRNDILIEFSCYEDSTWTDWTLLKRTLQDESVNLWDAYSDSEYIPLDIQPVMVDGEVLVPASVIAQTFVAEVQWDSGSNTVIISADTSGERKSADEIRRIEEFRVYEAWEIAREKYHIYHDEPMIRPLSFSRKGCFFSMMVITLGDAAKLEAEYGRESVEFVEAVYRTMFKIDVYDDGTIIEFR